MEELCAGQLSHPTAHECIWSTSRSWGTPGSALAAAPEGLNQPSSPGAFCPLSVPAFGDRFAFPACQASSQHLPAGADCHLCDSNAEKSLFLGTQHPSHHPGASFIHPPNPFPIERNKAWGNIYFPQLPDERCQQCSPERVPNAKSVLSQPGSLSQVLIQAFWGRRHHIVTSRAVFLPSTRAEQQSDTRRFLQVKGRAPKHDLGNHFWDVCRRNPSGNIK